ncbi:MAG: ATP-binding protein [Clostridiales Family XIII bacterium]|jgi:ATP-dependent 26S proteasome regulatory subunit|nr:ATP-binding protein [Clostridiales Family XIII bacterium]
MGFFKEGAAQTPFADYDQYMSYLFACADRQLRAHLNELMGLFASEQGGYKNALYPDIEIAYDLTGKRLGDFLAKHPETSGAAKAAAKPSAPPADEDDDIMDVMGAFADEADQAPAQAIDIDMSRTSQELIAEIRARAEITDEAAVPMPLHRLSEKCSFSDFTLFCFACAILSSTQTNYASVFQVIGQNANLSAPTFESAARVYYGSDFSIARASGVMSEALEKLQPLFDLKINGAMPFSTQISPDKRLLDFLFGENPRRPDEGYRRFLKLITDDTELDPMVSGADQSDALTIAFDDGCRLFSLFGDEGSGRKFTIRHFCAGRGTECVSLDCGKLFSYDFSFVEKALWAVNRECILLNACCCLDNLSFREEEREKFMGYMDLAFGTLAAGGAAVFALSREKLPMKEITAAEYTQLELPTPNNGERELLWRHYAQGYEFDDDVDLDEMAAKFLFTAGKVRGALRMGRSLSAMRKEEKIGRAALFEACYNQMSHELTQKATKIKATYTWDDIVMSADQRQSLEYACDQMRFRKQVYEQWNYNRKYPYGRGLSVLLFGAPGTGKSMCAQVLANALDLELYRVDLSKVVDKYVGETEKSISMIFREAKKCNVVLFFDECDTLFAKRSDDGGSSQSSNNNKTALLLQEVEAYDGVSVLATNYKHNIDPAFFRRMKFIVEFQFPDAGTRKILWDATIPKNTPLAEDVDIKFLADRFEFVGGNIKNCILNAAFLAAGDPEANGEVHMKHYLLAIRYEFVKTGKVFTRSDFEPYADLIL